MKIALVYDRVNKIGGAERVLQALHEVWPEAPLYTAVYNPQTAPWAKVFPKVIPSFLQNFPFAMRHELYASLMPLAFESFNFDEFEVVISVTSEAAKGIITKPKTLHICYCLTPTRYLWSQHDLYFQNSLFRFLSQPVVSYLRSWDKVAAQRPDVMVAISRTVQERIKKYYDLNVSVLYPPVGFLNSKSEILNPKQIQNSKYFLIVSRLVPYKRIDLVIEAFNELDLPLKIVGTGVEEGRLKRLAGKNIEFLEQLTDQQLLGYYQRCQAVIFPGEEDLGLVPLEAAACGKPVIAYRGGGALETVIEGKTGEFFPPSPKATGGQDKQLVDSLAGVLKKFKPERYQPEDCRKQAEKFDVIIFKNKFQEFIEQQWKIYSKNIFT